jgi:hypothetical protein
MMMDEISPRTKKKIKTKLLADYGIESSPPMIRKPAALLPRKSLSSLQAEDVSALTVHSASDDSDDDLYS